MNKIKIIAPDFMNPRWFGAVIHRNFPAIVESNAVVIEGETLTLGEPLKTGTRVRVFLAGQFYAVLESDIEEETRKLAEQREEAAVKRRDMLNSRRAAAAAFNASINLPAAWRISQKEVLSGLSANSNGDGCFRNTVQHIELLAELNVGRLRRRKNAFLCTSKSGNNGNSWSGGNTAITYMDGEGGEYMPQPTCKQCLKLVEHFRKILP